MKMQKSESDIWDEQSILGVSVDTDSLYCKVVDGLNRKTDTKK